ncbi:MAG: TIGR00159 family protein [Fibrobacter sp.]|nr:TIGR00159 family protein [Fibrobacter sp.]
MLESFKLFGVIDIRFADILDLFFVSVFFYYTFLLFRGTRAVQMFFGFAILILGWFVARWWGLHGVTWLFAKLSTVGVVVIVILFQPEIRGALARIGQTASQFNLKRIFFHEDRVEILINEIVDAVQELSRNNYGALIVLEKFVGLRNFEDTGQPIDAQVSSRLLRSIFFPNNPLHDGAVIISQNRIKAAGCILPMSALSTEIDSSLGMRHRAARALTAESDAVVIVVSEETAIISIAYRNTLRRRLSLKELEEELKRHFHEKHEK